MKQLLNIVMTATVLAAIALVCMLFVAIVMLIGRIELFPVEQRVKMLEEKVRLLQQK